MGGFVLSLRLLWGDSFWARLSSIKKNQEYAGHGPPMRQSFDCRLRQKEIAGYGPLKSSFFYQEIAGHGPPMRHCNDGWLRQKEIAGYGPL